MPAAEPGFHEHGNPFEVPVRRRVARVRQVGVEDRFRVLVDRHDLAAEEAPCASVRPGCLVDADYVNHLVVHERADAFTCRKLLERIVHRRYVE